MLSLKVYSPLPPSCFSYEQTEGIYHRWEGTTEKTSLDAAVLAFRKGNQLPRATEDEVAEDTDRYQCFRLNRDRGENVMRRFCQDSERSWNEVSPQVPSRAHSGCKGCGAKV